MAGACFRTRASLLLVVVLTLTKADEVVEDYGGGFAGPNEAMPLHDNADHSAWPAHAAADFDEVRYIGPAYEGCCPQDGGGELLGCCASGGCCPHVKTGSTDGIATSFLDCCRTKSGTAEKHARESRVEYRGPAYDGCCGVEAVAALGGHMSCCAHGGCCPSEGGPMLDCCASLRDGGGDFKQPSTGDSRQDDRKTSSSGGWQFVDDDVRAERTSDGYDGFVVVGVDDVGTPSGNKNTLPDGVVMRTAAKAAAASSSSAADAAPPNPLMTFVLQTAVAMCVVAWVASVVVGAYLSRNDGRPDDETRGLL